MLVADLFKLGVKVLQFFIIVEYWSGLFKVEEVKVASSASEIVACKVQFSRKAIPDLPITDNGSQFASSVFNAFAREWQFKCRTSNLHYPQSNARKNAVKTC